MIANCSLYFPIEKPPFKSVFPKGRSDGAAQLQIRDMTAKEIYELLVYSQITHQEGPDFEDINRSTG
jgi:hypothetical protein